MVAAAAGGAAAAGLLCHFLGARAAATCIPYEVSTAGPPRGAPRPDAAGVASADCLVAGNTAVITGAGSGIGRATALRCAEAGMNVVLADIHAADLKSAAAEVSQRSCDASDAGGDAGGVLAVECDVSDAKAVQELQRKTWAAFGGCNFLMNNAAVQTNGRCGPYEHPERWAKILAVNLGGVINGCQAFVQPMLDSGKPGVVVNTGSKQGITMPPGDAAYNVSKAGVKTFTEALQHTLRNVDHLSRQGLPGQPGAKVNAFLLVPGWTITMIGTKGNRWIDGADRVISDCHFKKNSY
jgi:NAD(P)-dependent dehydrogenase (short-subunit alcohol dehydrogenase family)